MCTFNEGYESVKSIDPSVKAYSELLKKILRVYFICCFRLFYKRNDKEPTPMDAGY